MITFSRIKSRNFLSVGNAGIELELDAHRTILITGANGQGKSVLVDSLSFALYGKSYRKINKDALVNNINKRECLVELWLSDAHAEYHIQRGIKPNVFAIKKNGQAVQSQSSVNDLQAWFETAVLKMNHATFCQLVVLGSANYTPFMQLSAAQRREVVDSLLDISIFSGMSKLLRERVNAWDQTKNAIEGQIAVSAAVIATHETYQSQAQHERDVEVIAIKTSLGQLKTACIDATTASGLHVFRQRELLLSCNALEGLKRSKLQTLVTRSNAEAKIAKYHRQLQVGSPVDCPTCLRPLDTSHAEAHRAALEQQISAEEAIIQEATETLNKTEASIAHHQIAADEHAALSVQIQELKWKHDSLMKDGARLATRLRELQTPPTDQSEVEAARSTQTRLESTLNEHRSERSALDHCSLMLKDSGIKAAIIHQYIPAINQMVNKYLALFDFHAQVVFDDAFQERILLKNCEYEYNQFSMGQRMRFNLAVMFAWREIARMRVQASCNLLFFDEVFDSSLDAAGADDLMMILESLKDTNTLIISHRGDQLVERVSHHIAVEKVGNFTKLIQQ